VEPGAITNAGRIHRRNGAVPYAGVVWIPPEISSAATGNGGADNNGTVFENCPCQRRHHDAHRVLMARRRFATGGVILDSSDNLFGTTFLGGANTLVRSSKWRNGRRPHIQQRMDRLRAAGHLHRTLDAGIAAGPGGRFIQVDGTKYRRRRAAERGTASYTTSSLDAGVHSVWPSTA